MAKAAAISMGYLSEVERGIKEPSSEVLAGICLALQVDLEELLEAALLQLRHVRTEVAERRSGGLSGPCADSEGPSWDAGRLVASGLWILSRSFLGCIWCGSPTRTPTRSPDRGTHRRPAGQSSTDTIPWDAVRDVGLWAGADSGVVRLVRLVLVRADVVA